jgi:hypothetical protein
LFEDVLEDSSGSAKITVRSAHVTANPNDTGRTEKCQAIRLNDDKAVSNRGDAPIRRSKQKRVTLCDVWAGRAPAAELIAAQ